MDKRNVIVHRPSSSTVPARIVITEIGCGCVIQSWESKNINGVWEENLNRSFPCPAHMPSLMKGTDWGDQNV